MDSNGHFWNIIKRIIGVFQLTFGSNETKVTASYTMPIDNPIFRGDYGTNVSKAKINNNSNRKVSSYSNAGYGYAKGGIKVNSGSGTKVDVGIVKNKRLEIQVGSPFGKNQNIAVGVSVSKDLFIGLSYEYERNNKNDNGSTAYFGNFSIGPKGTAGALLAGAAWVATPELITIITALTGGETALSF